MGGESTSKEKLNRTLEKVCGILNENNVSDWFIFFGTLLGITRENSCIEGDDDLDIMIDYSYEELRSIFEKEGFSFVEDKVIKNPSTILKTKQCDKYASIDFYICETNEAGDFYTPWHRVLATQSRPIRSKRWRSVILNLPNSYLEKIIAMYGEDWKIPKHNAGCRADISV